VVRFSSARASVSPTTAALTVGAARHARPAKLRRDGRDREHLRDRGRHRHAHGRDLQPHRATINGNLGLGTLTQGAGTTALNGTASAGTVNVNGGTLQLGASERLADTAALTIAAAGTLDLQTFNETVGTASILGTLAGTGTLTAATYSLDGATINGNLGTGTLTQVGGTSTLNGTSGAGIVNVDGGTLLLGSNDRLADVAAVTVASGAILDLATFSDTVGSLALSGTLDGTGTLTAATYTLNGATVNANLGTGTLTQAGGTTSSTAQRRAIVNVEPDVRLGADERLADSAASPSRASGRSTCRRSTKRRLGDHLRHPRRHRHADCRTYALDGANVNANLGAGTLSQSAAPASTAPRRGTVNVDAARSARRRERLATAPSLTVARAARSTSSVRRDVAPRSSRALDGTGTLTAHLRLDGAW
jgi:hypothetical protein